MPIFFHLQIQSIQDKIKIASPSLSSPLASHSPTSFRSKTLDVDWCGRSLYLYADDDSDSEPPNQSRSSSNYDYDHRKIDS